MKILGLILMMAFFNISSGDNSEAYLNQVSDKYQAYNVVYQAYDEDYEICIINGVMNGYQSYGVYFYSNTKNSFTFFFIPIIKLFLIFCIYVSIFYCYFFY